MTTKFPGLSVVLGTGTFVVPPLNLRSLQEFGDRLATFNGGIDAESQGMVVDAAWHALRRNYPDITRDQLLDMIDLGNMQAIMEAVMDVSGLRRKAQEAEMPGEMPAQ
jgi:hypothetical protein